MLNKFKISEEPSDRRFFTIVPNYVINHSTPYERSIYLYMKRLAGEHGSCWASNQTIAEHEGCSRNTVAKYIKQLVKRGWIKQVGYRSVGQTKQKVAEYRIVDLWDQNNQFYAKKKVSNNDSFVPIKTRKVSTVDEKVSTIVHKEDLVKKNHTIYKAKPSFADDTNRAIDLFKEINPNYKNLFKNKTQRKACSDLMRIYKLNQLEDIVLIVKKTNLMPYAPVITTPLQLLDKLGSLQAFISKQQNKRSRVAIIS